MNNQQSSIAIALALHGQEFAMLSEQDLNRYRFLRDQGRKFGITVDVMVIHSCDEIEDEIKSASRLQQEAIYRRERSEIGVGFAGSSHRWGLGDATEIDSLDPAKLLGITAERYEDLAQCLRACISGEEKS